MNTALNNLIRINLDNNINACVNLNTRSRPNMYKIY